MDKHYLYHPEKGAKRMHVWLTKDKGYGVSKNRIDRLYYRVMGLRAVLPGRHTSKRNKEHKAYP
jgi:putative transposase